ncbi:DUF4249 domain-containing protein [Neolewinella lacunae]|uniref:DUF4249 domain-containing protein n=1 Tax=Neolewinella lacunae TaxID=1517758 RepID=A0A923T8Z2_9BACT|nr:DUF4249 domain-containing protein [Neolewinella lacunae]MBC6994498.1 DUF4249 domain-containing protein [Neolewinella lacunae]MDN3634191.1 DUF4249 domain-containing protein [Neolewinella lacunae]
MKAPYPLFVPRVCCLLLVGLLVLPACEEPIDSPVEIIEPKLVLSSTFSPGKKVRVYLSITQPITGEVRLQDIRNADVRLYEGPQLLESLIYMPGAEDAPGYYQTVSFEPQVGRRYTLHASAGSLTPVSAESYVPTSIPITSLTLSELNSRDIGTLKVYDFELNVDYNDPEDEVNYYDLRISQEIIPFRVNASGDTTFYEAITKSVQAPGPILSPNGRPGQASILVKDKPNSRGVTLALQSQIEPKHEKAGNLIAELRTVSEPYFQFQRNVQGEGAVFGGINEPSVNIYTNVRQGYGLFAGFNSVVSKITLAE